MKNLFLILLCFVFTSSSAQQFIHPGIDQSSKDLEQMKKLVVSGQEPYKSAFERLKAITDTDFKVKAHTQVLRGLMDARTSAAMTFRAAPTWPYNNALVWYITKRQTLCKPGDRDTERLVTYALAFRL
jgi:hypothetical protein